MIVSALQAAWGVGDIPNEAREVYIMERFGWTHRDIDRCDMARLWRGMTLLDVYRVASKHRDGGKLSRGENELYGKALQYEIDLGEIRGGGDVHEQLKALRLEIENDG